MSSPKENESSFETEIVLLQEGWWELSGDILQDIARRAFRKKIRVSDVDDKGARKKKKAPDEDNDWIVAGFPMFSVNYRGVLFMIMTIPEPYFENKEEAAESASDLRLARAIADHDTHITVNMVYNGSDLDAEGRQRLLGRFLAYFTWYPRTLAVLWPKKNVGRVWDKKLRRALRDRPALEALKYAEGQKEPVTRVTPSDEEIHRASEEARRRWPELVAAYEHRTEGQEFFVKAPFKDGEHTEHMWTQVAALEDEFVVATVQNDPVNLTKFKKGTRVRFRHKILSDWFYGTQGGEVVGLFVEKLLHEQHNQRMEERFADDDTDDFDDDAAGPPENDEGEEGVRAGAPPAPVRAAPRTAAPSERRAVPPVERGGGGFSPLVITWICLAGLVLLGALGTLGYLLFRPEAPPPAPPVADIRPPVDPGIPNPNQNPNPQGGNPVQAPKVAPQRRGGNSGEHIMRNFLEALGRKDWKAAHDCTTPAFQQRQPLGDFERAVREHKLLEGPGPLWVDWSPRDPQGRQAAAVRFDRVPARVPPLLRAVCLADDAGWWIDQIDWVPGAAEQGLALLKKASAPPRRGGVSDEHIVRTFAQALERKDLKAAHDCLSPALHERLPFAEFAKAVQAHKISEGPMPLRVRRAGKDAQGRLVSEAHFNRLTRDLPPLFRTATLPSDTGWWVDALDWTPGAAEQALAGLPKDLPSRQRGGNSSEHILRDFMQALQRKDLKAAYACTTLEFQRRQPFAEFEKAVLQNKVWEGPMPLSLRGEKPDAQKRPVGGIYFARFPFNREPFLRAACVADDTGWWIDALEWNPVLKK